MVKVKLDWSDGHYSATILLDEEAQILELKGYQVVEVSEAKALEWAAFCKQSDQWSSYWRQLDNHWYENRQSDDY
jgi:hypothetical protein